MGKIGEEYLKNLQKNLESAIVDYKNYLFLFQQKNYYLSLFDNKYFQKVSSEKYVEVAIDRVKNFQEMHSSI